MLLKTISHKDNSILLFKKKKLMQPVKVNSNVTLVNVTEVEETYIFTYKKLDGSIALDTFNMNDKGGK